MSKSALQAMWVLTFLAVLGSAYSLVGTRNGLIIPSDWPESFQGYEEGNPKAGQAKTLDVATGLRETVLIIRFDTREEFESLWPAALKVKSPGAPLRLFRVGGENTTVVTETGDRPQLRIRMPNTGALILPLTGDPGLDWTPDGWSSPNEPRWTRPADGEWPEFVMLSEDGKSWIPADFEKPTGFIHRARTDLELIIDGQIIDLNRIPLPPDTPIEDRRGLE